MNLLGRQLFHEHIEIGNAKRNDNHSLNALRVTLYPSPLNQKYIS